MSVYIQFANSTNSQRSLEMVMKSKQKKSRKQQLDKKDGSCCWWCGKDLAPSEQTLEHMIPRSMGGGNNLENLRIACRQCNSSRRNNPFPPNYSVSWERFDQLASLRINNINKAHDSAIATTTKIQKSFTAATGVDPSIARQ
jgi:hypothetical protein